MRWADVDFENSIWFLSQTSTRAVDGKTVIGQRTKTGEARKVGLAPELVQAIKAQRKFTAKIRMKSHIWTDNDLVFPSERGTVKDSHNVRKLLQTALPDWEFGFHGIRHWFASLGLQSNVGAVAVARFLGDQSVSTTQDIYGHMLEDGSAKIPDAVREAIRE
jgi:integrase